MLYHVTCTILFCRTETSSVRRLFTFGAYCIEELWKSETISQKNIFLVMYCCPIKNERNAVNPPRNTISEKERASETRGSCDVVTLANKSVVLMQQTVSSGSNIEVKTKCSKIQ